MIDTIIEKGKELFKSRKIKSRGIALTHKDQGYSANQRSVSLLMKAEAPENLTVEIIKNLEQVQLKISMEEFLRRFYGLWYDDAELLTKLLGFETQCEYNASQEDADDWQIEWNKQHQEYLDEKLSSITLIKRAKAGETLSLNDQFELIKTRKAFEDGCAEHKVEFDAVAATEVPAEETKPVIQAEVQKAENNSSAGASKNTNEEIPVDKEVDVTKSAAFTELQKELAAQTELMKSMQAQIADAQEIIKAQKAAKREIAINKAAAMPFVAEDQREAVADVIENPAMAAVVAVLEKAVAALTEKDTALTAKDAEIEEIKKSFGDGASRGVEGDLSPAALGANDAQAKLDEVIKAAVAKTKAAQTA